MWSIRVAGLTSVDLKYSDARITANLLNGFPQRVGIRRTAQIHRVQRVVRMAFLPMQHGGL
jgi:hypothetical protein